MLIPFALPFPQIANGITDPILSTVICPASSGKGVRSKLVSAHGWVAVGEGMVVGVAVGGNAAVGVWLGDEVAVRVGEMDSPEVVCVWLDVGDEIVSGWQAVREKDRSKIERRMIRDKRLNIVPFLF
jgi:hypothetical protein